MLTWMIFIAQIIQLCIFIKLFIIVNCAISQSNSPTSPGLYPPKLPVLTTGDTYFNFSQNIYFLQPKDFHSLRAPPSLA
jgi:hypothetical protein